MKKRALLVSTDDRWEGLWIDGELYSQYHEIEEGYDRGLFFLKLAEEYNLTFNDFQLAHTNEKADEYLSLGSLPKDINEVLKIVDLYEY